MKLTLEKKIERLNYHRELYYNGTVVNVPAWLEDEPPLSDAEFDALFEEVKALAPNDPSVNDVGAIANGVKHEVRMGSLAKVKGLAGVKEWHGKHSRNSKDLVIMPKVDGLSLDLLYRLSGLNEASTRGNGDVGESVRDKVEHVDGCPLVLKFKDKNAEIRGEVVMPLSVFRTLNEQGEELSNPRNAAVGSLKQDDASITAKRGLKFWSYEIFGKYKTQAEKLQTLSTIEGLNVPDWYLVEYTDDKSFWEEIEAYVKNFEKNIRPNLDYATDGLVFALNDMQDQEDAGWSSNMHHPIGKLAYKFEPEEKETTIIGYHLQVGKTGRIVPVADLDMVVLDGAEVASPTLHNFGNMVDNGLFPGAVVKVVRANDVIPYIKKEVVKPVFQTFKDYPVCPCCGSKTTFDGVNLWCENQVCPARRASQMVHFIKTVNCLNVGKTTIKKLINSGFIKDLTSLVNPESVKAVAIGMGSTRMNSREAEIVYNALKSIRNLPLPVFIEALGIHNVGKGTSKRLVNEYKTLDNLMNTANYSDLVGIDDIGPVTAKSIMDAFDRRGNEIKAVAEIVGIAVVKTASNNLNGKTFLFTGTLSQPRKYFEGLVEANGGKLCSSVSKNLNYLIVGEDSGSKLDKARKLGIPTITEEEFVAMVQGR